MAENRSSLEVGLRLIQSTGLGIVDLNIDELDSDILHKFTDFSKAYRQDKIAKMFWDTVEHSGGHTLTLDFKYRRDAHATEVVTKRMISNEAYSLWEVLND